MDNLRGVYRDAEFSASSIIALQNMSEKGYVRQNLGKNSHFNHLAKRWPRLSSCNRNFLLASKPTRHTEESHVHVVSWLVRLLLIFHPKNYVNFSILGLIGV